MGPFDLTGVGVGGMERNTGELRLLQQEGSGEKKMNLQVQEAEWTTHRVNPKKSEPGHILIQLLESNQTGRLKAAREEHHLTYRGK